MKIAFDNADGALRRSAGYPQSRGDLSPSRVSGPGYPPQTGIDTSAGRGPETGLPG
jgi:hypothetical protein